MIYPCNDIKQQQFIFLSHFEGDKLGFLIKIVNLMSDI